MNGFDDAGLAVGEVYGVRWWTVDGGGVQKPLRLRGMQGEWLPGENTAVCKRAGYVMRHGEDAVPAEECGCGFWAYWTPQAAPVPAGCRAVGVIKGYGRTLVGEKGFRCEKAEIVALTLGQVEQRRVVEEHAVQGWVPVPATGRPLPHSGMDTYTELGGRPSYMPDPSPPQVRFEDDWAAQAMLEHEIIDAYQVPVYTSIEVMLARHPPTTDYLPPPPSAEEIDQKLAELLAQLSSLGVRIDDVAQAFIRMAPKTLEGKAALDQLMKHYGAPPKP